MNWSFILILALFVVVGCVDKERNTFGSIEKVATEIATPTVQYHHDESRYPTFMLSKQSRFEMQAKEEKQKFNQLFKFGFEEPTTSTNSEYSYKKEQRIRKNDQPMIILPEAIPVWNKDKQEVEVKWSYRPKYVFDAY
ncbi:hypothetical protein [Proteus mirabilis]|uniref:hypothetical protein n=1 Tax=Proteus mirabilis TaxID=584 RepID=UPI0034D4DEAC